MTCQQIVGTELRACRSTVVVLTLPLDWNSPSVVSWCLGLAVSNAKLLSGACLD